MVNKYATTKDKPDHQNNVTEIPYEHVTTDFSTYVPAQQQNVN